MTFILVGIAIIATAAYIWFRKSNREQTKSDEQRTVELLNTARTMFPEVTDVEALDLLYQHKYREMLFRRRQGWDCGDLQSETFLIWNERNRAIRRSLDYEELFYTMHGIPKR